MLTVEERKEFEDRGVVRLPGLLPQPEVGAVRDSLLTVLERRGIWRDGGWALDHLPFDETPAAGGKLVRDVKRHPALKELVTTDLELAITSLTGGKPFRPMMDSPQLLFTLPNARTWSVPSSIWHLDLPRLPGHDLPGVQMFTFLTDVAPQGGGTLVVAGSHRLLTGKFMRSRDVKKCLKRAPWFAELFSAKLQNRARLLAQPGRAGGVPVEVVELHGAAGDVYLMDIRLLHTLAPNAGTVPRMMATQRFLREDTWQMLSDLDRARATA